MVNRGLKGVGFEGGKKSVSFTGDRSSVHRRMSRRGEVVVKR